MSTEYNHVRINIIDDNNDKNICYPETTGSDVSVNRSANSNIPSSVTNVQELANSLGTYAFSNLINDAAVAQTTTWSSDKLDDILSDISVYVSGVDNKLHFVDPDGDDNTLVYPLTTGNCTLSAERVNIIGHSVSSTVTVSNATGAITVQSSDTSVATVSYSGSTITITSVADGTCNITVSIAGTTTSSANTKTIVVNVARVYGATWAGTTATTWTRTDLASSFSDPNPYYSGMSGSPSSPFDNIPPWSGMTRVTDDTVGTLVQIPKFYFKWTFSGSAMTLRIATSYLDGYSVSPAHQDRGDGAGERDYVYIGRYHCNTSTYKSLTGYAPARSITKANFRTYIHNLGSVYWQNDFMMWWTVRMLYLVEFASWDSQTKIGYGCAQSSGTVLTSGYTDTMCNTYHTGTTATSRTTYGGTQYRYIEGLWDACYDWIDGLYFSSADIYVITNPADFAETGGVLVGTRQIYVSGTATTWNNPIYAPGYEWTLYPNTCTGASYTTYTCDYMYNQYSYNSVAGGGYYSSSTQHGLFSLYSYPSTSSTGMIGSRLMKLP